MKRQTHQLVLAILADLEVYLKTELDNVVIYDDGRGNEDVFFRITEKEHLPLVASLVKKYNGRLVTLTPNVIDDETHELVYHFDIEGLLINCTITVTDKKIPSITPILKSADWTEREMKDLFGVVPEGHPNPKRLILDESLAEGVFQEYIGLSDAMAGAATNKLWEHINEAKRKRD